MFWAALRHLIYLTFCDLWDWIRGKPKDED